MPQDFSDDFDSINELRVAGSTPPKELAASIIHLLNDGKRVRMTAIGHQAVGQAVKAVSGANQYCIAQGYIVSILPSFMTVNVPKRETVLPGEDDDPERSTERTVTVLTLVRLSPQ